MRYQQAATALMVRKAIEQADGTVRAGGSSRELTPWMGRLALAMGADGIFVEVHDRPDESLCDATRLRDATPEHALAWWWATPAPPYTTWGNECYIVPSQSVSSLRGCAALCSEQGGTGRDGKQPTSSGAKWAGEFEAVVARTVNPTSSHRIARRTRRRKLILRPRWARASVP
mgnify:CR=1 FL=1